MKAVADTNIRSTILDPSRRVQAGAQPPEGRPREREGPAAARMRAEAVVVNVEIVATGIADVELGLAIG